MTRSIFATALIAATALAGLAIAPSSASAQAAPYGYGGGYYDACQRDTTDRGTVGGLTGAAIGATVGSGIAARGVRTEGAVLGGLLGAAVGASVGQQSAACTSNGYSQGAYAPPPPPPPPVIYENHEPYRDYGYGYGLPAQPYDPRDRADDQCTMAPSDIHMPDGRNERRYVRVCLDTMGRYQVVD